jgi:hypothetical protein
MEIKIKKVSKKKLKIKELEIKIKRKYLGYLISILAMLIIIP